jgi:hypothetical protein
MIIKMPSYNEFWRTKRLSEVAMDIVDYGFQDEICSLNDWKGTLEVEWMHEKPHPTFIKLLQEFWENENENQVSILYKSKPIQNDL